MTDAGQAARDALEPCPFCGCHEVEAYKPALSAVWSVYCTSCEIRGHGEPTEAQAIAAWNTRAALANLAPEAVNHEYKALRDNARWLVDRVSHHGSYAQIDQDHIDALRDAVNAYDASTQPPTDAEAMRSALEACAKILPRFVHSVSADDKHIEGRKAYQAAIEALASLPITKGEGE